MLFLVITPCIGEGQTLLLNQKRYQHLPIYRIKTPESSNVQAHDKKLHEKMLYLSVCHYINNNLLQ